MNIHFSQVERRSQLSSYIQVAQAGNNDLPAVIPAPLPPAVQAQAGVTPEPVVEAPSILVPQAIPAPLPSMP